MICSARILKCPDHRGTGSTHRPWPLVCWASAYPFSAQSSSTKIPTASAYYGKSNITASVSLNPWLNTCQFLINWHCVGLHLL